MYNYYNMGGKIVIQIVLFYVKHWNLENFPDFWSSGYDILHDLINIKHYVDNIDWNNTVTMATLYSLNHILQNVELLDELQSCIRYSLWSYLIRLEPIVATWPFTYQTLINSSCSQYTA